MSGSEGRPPGRDRRLTSEMSEASLAQRLRRREEAEAALRYAEAGYARSGPVFGPEPRAGADRERPAPAGAAPRSRYGTILAATVLGLVIGVGGTTLLAGREPLADLRVAMARLLMPDGLRERYDLAVVGAGAPAAVASLDVQAQQVEQRLLAMLERSDLAMRQLAELDQLREAEIERLSEARLPAWADADGTVDPTEARILQMMVAAGALDSALDALKDAPGVVGDAAATDAAASTAGAAPGTPTERTILAMVGQETGLLETLNTLDRLRGEVAGALAERSPSSAELRTLGDMERALRALLVYVQQVEDELTGAEGAVAASAVPLPEVPPPASATHDTALQARIVELVARTRELHARLGG